eukprot:5988697-Pleurochrysis_carterae.AAC.1
MNKRMKGWSEPKKQLGDLFLQARARRTRATQKTDRHMHTLAHQSHTYAHRRDTLRHSHMNARADSQPFARCHAYLKPKNA